MKLSDIFEDWSSLKEYLLGTYKENYVADAEKRLNTSTKTYNKYVKAKLNTQHIGMTYRDTKLEDREEIAQKLLSCGNRFLMARNKETGGLEVAAGYFCQKRLCALCAFRRSVKKFLNTSEIIAQPEYKNMQWIFITLTIRNCKGEDLKLTIERLLSAFAKMTDNKTTAFRKSFKGWFRSLEVTYNEQRKDYHPHLHVLACVEKDYFRTKKYFSKDRLIQHWKKFLNKADYEVVDEIEIDVMRGGHRNQHIKMRTKKKTSRKFFEPIDYGPSVKIKKVYGNRADQISEVAKYTVKPVDYSGKPEVLETLTTALDRVRCTAYGGLMRQTFQRLKLTDTEDEVDTSQCETKLERFLADPKYTLYLLSWNGGARVYDMALYEKETGNVWTAADEALSE